MKIKEKIKQKKKMFNSEKLIIGKVRKMYYIRLNLKNYKMKIIINFKTKKS